MIYDALFRPLLLTTGMFDQVRSDHGREFDLLLAVQDAMSQLRIHLHKVPYNLTQSKHNLKAERVWVELNQRVNYPIKAALCALEADGTIDMDDDVQRFCVSWATVQVAHVGAMIVVRSWNAHRIPGRKGGIPNVWRIEHRTQPS